MNYYNEFDPFAAAWLRELIKAGDIPPGDVDERSIEDVRPEDLAGYTQCHFFAGIGGWSRALALAGWPVGRPVWTGSCPCQPFSAAGKGAGFADERHLWPAFHWLISECRPPVVIGEQVASKAADVWLDLVQTDLEALDYAFGCVAFPAAGVGAPHLRDRTFWVGHSLGAGLEGHGRNVHYGQGWQDAAGSATEAGSTGGVANSHEQRRKGVNTPVRTEQSSPVETVRGGEVGDHQPGGQGGVQGLPGSAIGLANGALNGRREEREDTGGGLVGDTAQGISAGPGAGGGDLWAGPVNGFWADADWLLCRDGKWRPVKPGISPLVDGLPRGVVPGSRQGMAINADETAEARVGRLKGYGNAIVPEAAAVFIEATGLLETPCHP